MLADILGENGEDAVIVLEERACWVDELEFVNVFS